MDIPVLPCLVTCYSATTYLLPQHTAAVWILVVAICPQHPLSTPLAPEAGRRPWRQRRGRRVLGANSGPHFGDHRGSAMTRSHGGIVADWNSHQVRCDGFFGHPQPKNGHLRAKRRVHGTVAGWRLGHFLKLRNFLLVYHRSVTDLPSGGV